MLGSQRNANPAPQQNLQIQQIKQLMQQVRNSPNPQAMWQNVLSQNSVGLQIMNLINMSNGNLRQVAQFMAQQQNIDLNALINELQS